MSNTITCYYTYIMMYLLSGVALFWVEFVLSVASTAKTSSDSIFCNSNSISFSARFWTLLLFVASVISYSKVKSHHLGKL